MARRLTCVFLVLCFFCVPAHAHRFKNLDKKLKFIANKNYGSKVFPDYSIGIAFIDLRSGYQVSVRGNRVFPAASIIKIPVMAYLYAMSDKGYIKLSEKIAFGEKDKLPGAGVLQWLKPNTYSIWNLCRMMISLSDNTATRLVVNRLGKQKITSYSRAVGMKNTSILDETALAEAPDTETNTMTANDTAKLLYKIEKRIGFSKKARKDMLSFMLKQKYRFGIPKVLPKNFTCANKTGNLTNVLHDAAIVYSGKGAYVLVVFTKGFKTVCGRDRNARLVINEVSKAVAGYYR